MPNGVAYSDGQLQIGDILLKIDGETVANGRHKKGLGVVAHRERPRSPFFPAK